MVRDAGDEKGDKAKRQVRALNKQQISFRPCRSTCAHKSDASPEAGGSI